MRFARYVGPINVIPIPDEYEDEAFLIESIGDDHFDDDDDDFASDEDLKRPSKRSRTPKRKKKPSVSRT